MQKVDGINGVRVSLNDGLTILDLKPGNVVTMAKLRQIIKSNGFVPKEAIVIARGTSSGERSFVVSGTNEKVVLSAAAEQARDSWKLAVAAVKP
jgi:hypothetical protein